MNAGEAANPSIAVLVCDERPLHRAVPCRIFGAQRDPGADPGIRQLRQRGRRTLSHRENGSAVIDALQLGLRAYFPSSSKIHVETPVRRCSGQAELPPVTWMEAVATRAYSAAAARSRERPNDWQR
jgi:hypothetical protein